MTDLPPYDRIMWRGKTLAAMSETELRSALRECWVERKARAAVTPQQKPHAKPPNGAADIKAKIHRFSDVFDQMFSQK